MDDTVFVKDFPSGKQWLTGTVSDVKGPLTYLVTLSDGRIVRRHIDHLCCRISQAIDLNSDNDVEISTLVDSTLLTLSTPSQGQTGPTLATGCRRSTRNRVLPERYEPSI